jgi:hypothetical protein
MISTKEAAEWASAMMVIVSGGLAGHFAYLGMTPVQWRIPVAVQQRAVRHPD